MPHVTTIPATKTRHHKAAGNAAAIRRRVAAYARVSTDLEEQQSSYQAQIDYYTSYIQSRPDWEFAGMYSDEGITGTSTKHREGFKSMIADALAGKIDLIITKSVSRFARNTVDTLTYVRQLKEYGVEVFFEKENIYTLDAKGELLITIMSSLAQEEARSISENVTWAHRKRFAQGKAIIPYRSILGYKKGEDGGLAVDESQAPTVRLIYQLFIDGHSIGHISQELTRRGLKTVKGKTNWSTSSIRSILSNEKYKGDLLLQKTYTTDFLTKQVRQNTGEIPQYYVKDNHEPIIDPDTFDQVQYELVTRYANRGTGKHHLFSGRIKCCECGAWYGRKTWHSTTNPKHVWHCNNKHQGGQTCTSPTLTEPVIKDCYQAALNQLISTHTDVTHLVQAINDALDTNVLDKQILDTKTRLREAEAALDQLIARNQTLILDQAMYQAEYQQAERDWRQTHNRLETLQAKRSEQESKRASMLTALHAFTQTPPHIDHLEARYVTGLLDHATAHPDRIDFTFKNGQTITISLPSTD